VGVSEQSVLHMYVFWFVLAERNAIDKLTFSIPFIASFFIWFTGFKHCIAILLVMEGGGQRAIWVTYVRFFWFWF